MDLVFLPEDDREGRDRSSRELESLLWRAPRDPDARRVLESVYFALRRVPVTSVHVPVAAHFERALADELRAATRSGRLQVREEVVDDTRGGGGFAASRPLHTPPPARERAPQVEPDTWIAIELVDEDGEPVPNMAYRIETPDGLVRTGMTNAHGRAREEGLYAGTCKVTFPELHAPEWKRAG